MAKNVTRTELISMWCVVVTAFFAGAVVLRGAPGLWTATMLLALSIAPVVMALLLWPQMQPRTAADVLYGRNGSI